MIFIAIALILTIISAHICVIIAVYETRSLFLLFTFIILILMDIGIYLEIFKGAI